MQENTGRRSKVKSTTEQLASCWQGFLLRGTSAGHIFAYIGNKDESPLESHSSICAETVLTCVSRKWAATHLPCAHHAVFRLPTLSSSAYILHTLLLFCVSIWGVKCCSMHQARGRGVKCRSVGSTSNILQTTIMLQEVSATLCCNDLIWHSREEGYRWGVVCHLTELSPSKLQKTPQRRVWGLLSSARLKKWTKSGFIFWWFWYFVKVSKISLISEFITLKF